MIGADAARPAPRLEPGSAPRALTAPAPVARPAHGAGRPVRRERAAPAPTPRPRRDGTIVNLKRDRLPIVRVNFAGACFGRRPFFSTSAEVASRRSIEPEHRLGIVFHAEGLQVVRLLAESEKINRDSQ